MAARTLRLAVGALLPVAYVLLAKRYWFSILVALVAYLGAVIAWVS